MTLPRAHVLHEVEARAFVGNEAFECHTFELGSDELGVRAPVARAIGTFVRVQCHLDPNHWLDVDAVLSDCRRSGDGWTWHLTFVKVDEPSPAVLARFIQHHVAHAEVHPRPPAPPPSQATPVPPKDTGARPREEAQKPTGKRDLSELYREALNEVAGKR